MTQPGWQCWPDSQQTTQLFWSTGHDYGASTFHETQGLTVKESARLDCTDEGPLVLTKVNQTNWMGSANRVTWFSSMVTEGR